MQTTDAKARGVPSLRVAMCQVYTEEWAIDANLARTLEALEEAAAEGAELAITPECVLHGYASADCQDYADRMLDIAEPPDGPNLRLLRDRAEALGLDVIVGFAERGQGTNVHNSAALISREGEILTVYRKVHCRPFESIEHEGVFVPGGRFEVTERRSGDLAYRVGIMICFDREITESTRCLRSLGAELIACPLATDTTNMARPQNRAHNEMITRCRAAENELYIVVVNHAGRFNGGSFAVGPQGELLHQMGSEAGVQVLDMPVSAVRERFHSDPLGWMGWGYRRPEVYRSYL
jgi:predicted amidohydrolase